MNLLDKVIGYIAPSAAVNRLQARETLTKCSGYEAAKKSRIRATANPESGKTESKQRERDRHCLRIEAREILKNDDTAKYAFRECQTYLAPTGWIPATADAALNEFIRAKLNSYAATCDIQGRKSLWHMFGLGAAQGIFDGDHALAVVKVDDMLKVQNLPAEYIGSPVADPKLNKQLEDLKRKGRYVGGLILGKYGEVSGVAIFKNEPHATGLVSNHEWAWQRTYSAANVFFYLDPIFADEYRGVTELAQAINKMKDRADSMNAISGRVKRDARIAGIMKNSDGEAEGNDFVPSFDKCTGADNSCEQQPVSIAYTDSDGVEILTMRTDEEYVPTATNTPESQFLEFMGCLSTALGNSLHLPSSQLGMKGKLQGTDIRVDMSRAEREYMRKRTIFEGSVYRPITESILNFLHSRGDFGTASLDEVIKGSFQYVSSPTADEGYKSQSLESQYKLGVISDDEFASAYGRNAHDVRARRKSDAKWRLEAAKELSDQLDLDFGVALRELSNGSGVNVSLQNNPQQQQA